MNDQPSMMKALNERMKQTYARLTDAFDRELFESDEARDRRRAERARLDAIGPEHGPDVDDLEFDEPLLTNGSVSLSVRRFARRPFRSPSRPYRGRYGPVELVDEFWLTVPGIEGDEDVKLGSRVEAWLTLTTFTRAAGTWQVSRRSWYGDEDSTNAGDPTEGTP